MPRSGRATRPTPASDRCRKREPCRDRRPPAGPPTAPPEVLAGPDAAAGPPAPVAGPAARARRAPRPRLGPARRADRQRRRRDGAGVGGGDRPGRRHRADRRRPGRRRRAARRGRRRLPLHRHPPGGPRAGRAVRAGELLPRSALEEPAELVQLALPVQAGYVPPGLERGQLVDVYAVADPAAGATGVADGSVTLVVRRAPGAGDLRPVRRGALHADDRRAGRRGRAGRTTPPTS